MTPIAEVVRRARENAAARRQGLPEPFPALKSAPPTKRQTSLPRPAEEQRPAAFSRARATAVDAFQAERRRQRQDLSALLARYQRQIATVTNRSVDLDEPRRIISGFLARALLPAERPDGTTDCYLSVDSGGHVRICFEIDGGV